MTEDHNVPTPPRPVSLREENAAPPPPERHSGNQFVLMAITAVAFLLAGVLIAVLVLDNDGDTLSEDTVREIVGTEIAARPTANNSSGAPANAAEVQQLIDNAVGTQIATLIPTSTPIPPTPTVIPNPVVTDDDAFVGPEDAPVVIVEFSDFQCGFCGRFYEETLPRIRETYPDQVKFVYRDFPIFGEDSARAAMAAECAHEQDTFWGMHDRIFEIHNEESAPALTQETLVSFAGELGLDTEAFATCLESERYLDEVVNDYQTAVSYGFQGTPGFVINGVVYAFGAQPFETFQAIIDRELEAAGSAS